MQEKEDKVPLTPSEKEIQDILTNNIQYDD